MLMKDVDVRDPESTELARACADCGQPIQRRGNIDMMKIAAAAR
jgi:hypothetical protein